MPPPSVLNVPTGSGKTLAVLLAWLWRRRAAQEEVRVTTPRRLVYCLPTRALVEQTYATAWTSLKGLDWLGPNDGRPGEAGLGPAAGGDEASPGGVRLHYLMGGHSDDDWTLHPEDDAILIGTQDMLLSRALNRGYGMSRFRWPAAFGLLNSDALWVCDEIQLMNAGLVTTRQLDAFRRTMGTSAPTGTIWMSATLQRDWLQTVDHPTVGDEDVLMLGQEDQRELHHILHARKVLNPADIRGKADVQAVAKWLATTHRAGTQTLVVVNTVTRAQDIYRALIERFSRAKDAPELLLLHSRFRTPERAAAEARLRQPAKSGAGRIVVSTQVVEAGVDITSDTLVTDLAPWPSLVQRFGRCNRDGKSNVGAVYWIDVKPSDAAPYELEDLDAARRVLEQLRGSSVAPADLPDVDMQPSLHDCIRRRDLLQLFDTTPDLTGNDVDVSRFIRDDDALDAAVFWRSVGPSGPNGRGDDERQAGPRRDETCAVPIGDLRGLLTRPGVRGWIWDHIADRWVDVQARGIRPGMEVLLDCATGGYNCEWGWDPASREAVPEIANVGEPPESVGSDRDSFRAWQTISSHTDDVMTALRRIIDAVALDERLQEALVRAARHHDWGKAHRVFQSTMRRSLGPEPTAEIEWAKLNAGGTQYWAKSGGPLRPRHQPPHFRHELASALAYLSHPEDGDPDPDLVAYLIAAHHGRVRVAIRSAPGEPRPQVDRSRAQAAADQEPIRYALGIAEGDSLPMVDLGGGVRRGSVSLTMAPMEMGRASDGAPSWAERILRMRDDFNRFGPFRLAFLEALLRAADARASMAVSVAGGTEASRREGGDAA